jgi:hypothetical protein
MSPAASHLAQAVLIADRASLQTSPQISIACGRVQQQQALTQYVCAEFVSPAYVALLLVLRLTCSLLAHHQQ